MNETTRNELDVDFINERLVSALKVLESVDFDAKGTAADYRKGSAFACGYAASAIQGVLVELLKNKSE